MRVVERPSVSRREVDGLAAQPARLRRHSSRKDRHNGCSTRRHEVGPLVRAPTPTARRPPRVRVVVGTDDREHHAVGTGNRGDTGRTVRPATHRIEFGLHPRELLLLRLQLGLQPVALSLERCHCLLGGALSPDDSCERCFLSLSWMRFTSATASASDCPIRRMRSTRVTSSSKLVDPTSTSMR